MPVGLASGVIDRNGRPIGHSIINTVFVEIPFANDPEVLIGILVRFLDRSAGKAKEPRFGHGRTKIRAKVLFLCAMAFIHHNDPVLGIGNR